MSQFIHQTPNAARGLSFDGFKAVDVWNLSMDMSTARFSEEWETISGSTQWKTHYDGVVGGAVRWVLGIGNATRNQSSLIIHSLLIYTPFKTTTASRCRQTAHLAFISNVSVVSRRFLNVSVSSWSRHHTSYLHKTSKFKLIIKLVILRPTRNRLSID